MRVLAALGAVVLLLPGCTSDPAPEPDPEPPVRVTGGALLAIAEEHLVAEVSDPDVERIHDPSCPASYRRITANADFDGSRIGIEVVTGHCHAQGFTCRPRREPRRTPLEDCSTRRLGDGRVLVAGRHDLYQGPSTWAAQVTGGGYVVRVGADVEGEWTLDDLADLASDPAYGPRVDPAYVARGGALTRP